MPTRPYAKEFFVDPPGEDACPVCGLSYARGSPSDKLNHRSYHRKVVETFEPRPNLALAKQHARHGVFIPVNFRAPLWMHKWLHRIALMFKRELSFDFVMWEERGDDGNGYIFTDPEGHALGGCVVRWREWNDLPDGWELQGIWVAPPYRRKGLMRNAWGMLTGQYEGILPGPPFSRSAAQFFTGCDELPEKVRQYAERTLASPPKKPITF